MTLSNRVETQEFQRADDNRWVPKAHAFVVVPGGVDVYAVPAPMDLTFATQAEARAWSCAMATTWLETNT